MSLVKLNRSQFVPGQAAFAGRPYSKTCPPTPPETQNDGGSGYSGGSTTCESGYLALDPSGDGQLIIVSTC